jgi:hypothetical protein
MKALPLLLLGLGPNSSQIAELRGMSFDTPSGCYVGQIRPIALPADLTEALAELESKLNSVSLSNVDAVQDRIDRFDVWAELSDGTKKRIKDLYVARDGAVSFRLA